MSLPKTLLVVERNPIRSDIRGAVDHAQDLYTICRWNGALGREGTSTGSPARRPSQARQELTVTTQQQVIEH